LYSPLLDRPKGCKKEKEEGKPWYEVNLQNGPRTVLAGREGRRGGEGKRQQIAGTVQAISIYYSFSKEKGTQGRGGGEKTGKPY